MGLQLVPCQLSLFPWRIDATKPTSAKVGMIDRAPDQLLRSAIAYCEWRAGQSWRNLSISSHRRDQDRQDYVDAVRLMNRARHKPETLLPVATRPAPPKKPPVADPLISVTRAQIVARIMALNPSLTDRKLLCGLSRTKLASMLQEAKDAIRAEVSA